MRALIPFAVLVAAAPAHAALTCRVDGLEATVNAAWAKVPACASLHIDDLVRHEDGFAIRTDGSASFLMKHALSRAVCDAGTWSVAVLPADDAAMFPCAEALCHALPVDELNRLDSSHLSGTCSEAPDPYARKAASWNATRLLWLLCALVALLGPLFTIPGWRFGESPGRLVYMTLAVVVAFGVAVRAWLAMHLTLQADEFSSWGLTHLIQEFDGIEIPNNPPLYRVLSWPVAALTGGDPYWGRAIPVGLGGVLIVATFQLGRSLVNPRVGLTAAALAALHPGLILATTYHRTYALFVVETALFLLSVVTALKQPDATSRYRVGLFASGMMLSHYFGAGILFGVVTWLAFSPLRGVWRSWLKPAAVLLVLVLPFVPAVLAGARQKASAAVPTRTRPAQTSVGPAHAWKVAEATPAAMAGFVAPGLEGTINTADAKTGVAAWSLLALIGLVAGLFRLPREARFAVLCCFAGAALLPPLLALKIVGIREFQTLGGAVPVVVDLAALVCWPARRSWQTGFAAAGLLGLVAVLGWHMPHAPHVFEETIASAADEVTAHASEGPFFVWPAHAIQRIARRLGVSRESVDQSVESTHPLIRILRSCSTSAVRWAGASLSRKEVRILLVDTDLMVDSSCDESALSGRAAHCELEREIHPGVRMIRCDVDLPAEPRSQPPSLDEPIGVGPSHEAAFIASVAPYTLGGPVLHGYRLMNIRILEREAVYELTGPDRIEIHAKAREAMAGFETDLASEPPANRLTQDGREASEALQARLREHLTSKFWMRAIDSSGVPR